MREYLEEKGALTMLEVTTRSPRKGTGGQGQGHRWWGHCLETSRRGAGAGLRPRAAGEGRLASRWWGEDLRIISVFCM